MGASWPEVCERCRRTVTVKEYCYLDGVRREVREVSFHDSVTKELLCSECKEKPRLST